MRLLLLSDIHANLSALEAVLRCAGQLGYDALILLGDIIDYGARPNETVALLQGLAKQTLLGIWGNHEHVILTDDASGGFSSQRGEICAAYTHSILTRPTKSYLEGLHSIGRAELKLDGKRYLFVHGNLEDHFWSGLDPREDAADYIAYDVVCSGHTHKPHLFEQFLTDNCPQKRNQRKIRFINPGSVGQPRNHNPRAQYALIDTIDESVWLGSATYNIALEQSLYPSSIPEFYKQRLSYGI